MTLTTTATHEVIVPKFDDDSDTDRKLAIICSDMITKSRMHDLKFTPVGNTATHMPMGITPFPGVTGMATHQLKKSIADLGVPEVPEFLEQIVAAGGHLWACRLSADMNHLTDADLYEGVEGIISASDFIEKTDGAQLLFI
jgi:peroxiredoxin family protein